MYKKNVVLAITLVSGFAVLPMAIADPTPEDAKDYRTAVMTSLCHVRPSRMSRISCAI
jgi:hypothetical protein